MFDSTDKFYNNVCVPSCNFFFYQHTNLFILLLGYIYYLVQFITTTLTLYIV